MTVELDIQIATQLFGHKVELRCGWYNPENGDFYPSAPAQNLPSGSDDWLEDRYCIVENEEIFFCDHSAKGGYPPAKITDITKDNYHNYLIEGSELVPGYSEDIAAAFEVIEWLNKNELYWRLEVDCMGYCMTIKDDIKTIIEYGKNIPELICITALKYVNTL